MQIKYFASLLMAMIGLSSCNQAQESNFHAEHSHELNSRTFVSLEGDTLSALQKSEDEWMAVLGDKEFYVLRKAGTERAFTGKYWDNKKSGIYTCAGCSLPLFTSGTKFKSGTGWPSFWEPIRPEHVLLETDGALGMSRTEVLCARCGGHQGHVFEDGPKPTGLRYCINSVSLNFIEGEEMKKP